MDIEVTTKQKVKVAYLQAYCGVRHWEDGTVNGKEDEQGTIPCREGEMWNPLIELKTGKILNWTQGVTADVHYKVCDAGEYVLLDEEKKEVKRIDGYVPKIMCPKDRGYGDYIIMDIDENGMIQKWSVDLEEFEEES